MAARPARARRRGARRATARRFTELDAAEQDALLAAHAGGRARRRRPGTACRRKLFFKQRLLHDIVHAYYAHPTAWNEIGFGGPASPRGYVRMGFDRRDPWEAAEAKPGDDEDARGGRTPCRMTPMHAPRATDGRAPDVFRAGGWVPMREYRDDEAVDFAIVGTGAGGGTLACRLAEAGLLGRRASTPARIGGRSRISPPTRREQNKLYWTDERIVDGDNPLQLGSNNSGKSVGGSTVHFAMVSLRFRPEWFKSRTHARLRRRLAARLARDVALLRRGRAGAEDRRPGELSLGAEAAALSLSAARAERRRRWCWRAAAEALGIDWTPTPLATVSAPRGHSPPCVYRGFCVIGCSTNAKQSALVTWIPRALAAGAEIRDLAMVGRIEIGDDGRATGVHYHREGRWRFQRARNVVVAGYAIETPRLLLNSANAALSRRARQQLRPGRQEPDGAVEPGGLGHDGRGDPLVQGAAVAGDHRALELRGHGKDFFGGYCYMSQGPLPHRLGRRRRPARAACGARRCATRWRNTTTRSG